MPWQLYKWKTKSWEILKQLKLIITASPGISIKCSGISIKCCQNTFKLTHHISSMGQINPGLGIFRTPPKSKKDFMSEKYLVTYYLQNSLYVMQVQCSVLKKYDISKVKGVGWWFMVSYDI